MQRSRDMADFQDFDAQYERRPSAWVEPAANGVPGAVELVEIPSGRETNDNIVAFWRPAQAPAAGPSGAFRYRLSWLAEPDVPQGPRQDRGRPAPAPASTASGACSSWTSSAPARRIDGLRIDLGASAGKISNVALKSNAPIHGLRASFELDPNNADLIELRLRVMRGDAAGHRNLAVPMDPSLSSAVAYPQPGPRAACRRRRRLPCRRRICATRRAAGARGARRRAVLFARIIWSRVTLGVTAYGIYQMLQVVRFASMTLLQGLMIFFFAVSLAWIAFAAGSVIAGASKRRDRDPGAGARHGGTLTALVMPIYNEDPRRTTAALQAMAEALARDRCATADSRSWCCPTRPMPTPGSARPWRSTACAARSPASCRSGTGGAGTTSRASPATSRTSSAAGADATIT